jgi:hypothetical protein
MSGTSTPPGTTTTEPSLLGIYLNDHLAGATGGVELVRRSAAAHRGSPTGSTLQRLADEIAADRDALLEIMAGLEVPVRQYKVYAAWVAEKVGRLKLNGHLLDRSPLSSLLEVEALRLGVEGKACLWRTLRELAEHEPRVDGERVAGLLQRAKEQVDTLEELRVQTSKEVFGAV